MTGKLILPVFNQLESVRIKRETLLLSGQLNMKSVPDQELVNLIERTKECGESRPYSKPGSFIYIRIEFIT